MQWALGVGEGGFLSQFWRGVEWLLFSQPQSHGVLGVKTTVSGARCLIHWLTHPYIQRKSCDKGLEAVKNQPCSATMLAMTYEDQVLNKGAGKYDPP